MQDLRSLLMLGALVLACTTGSSPEASQREARTAHGEEWVEPAATDRAADPAPDRPPVPAPVEPVFVGLDMSTFDTSCTRHSDCTNVRVHRCGPCGCSDTPLAVAAKPAFLEAQSAVDCSTYPAQTNPQASCGGCPGYRSRCVAGECVVEAH